VLSYLIYSTCGMWHCVPVPVHAVALPPEHCSLLRTHWRSCSHCYCSDWHPLLCRSLALAQIMCSSNRSLTCLNTVASCVHVLHWDLLMRWSLPCSKTPKVKIGELKCIYGEYSSIFICGDALPSHSKVTFETSCKALLEHSPQCLTWMMTCMRMMTMVW